MCAYSSLQDQKIVTDRLKLELQTVVGGHMGAENQT